MNSKRLPSLLSAFAIAPLLFALSCAEADKTERAPYSAQLDTNVNGQNVNTLTDADLKQVCASYASYVDTQISFDAIAEAACLVPAIILGGTPQGCQQQLDNCMSLFPKPVSIQAQVQSDALCVDSLHSCNGTLADVEGCVNVNLDSLLGVLRTLSCSGLNSNSQQQAAQVQDTLGVCANLDAACTAFITPTTQAPH